MPKPASCGPKDGINTRDERREARQATKQKLEETKQLEEDKAKNALIHAANAYFDAKDNLRSIDEVSSSFKKHVFPEWGENRELCTITPADVRALIQRIHTGGAPIMANRMLGRLKTFFNWAMDEDLIDSNPAAKVKRIMKEQERERVLSDNEIIAFWKACDRLGYPYGDCSRLLLLTG